MSGGAGRENVAEAVVELRNRHGLHVRTSSMMAKLALQFLSTITVSGPKGSANARSTVALVSLGAACGSQLRIRAVGPDAHDALAAIRNMVNEGFGDD